MAALRKGLEVPPEIRSEAARHLEELPNDYKWLPGGGNLRGNEFCPNHENDPAYSKEFSESSLTEIFLEMSEESLSFFVECINLGGKRRFENSWPDMDKIEMLKFVGLLLHFDIDRQNDLKNHWKIGKSSTVVQKSGISRDKFLRWYNNIILYKRDEHSSKEKATNKIYKVERYLDLVNKSMGLMRNPPTKDLSLDEEMAEFSGRSHLVQLIPSKPHSQGLKYYVIADPLTGYSYRCHLHSDSYVPFQDVWGRIIAICYNLLRENIDKDHKSYLDQGYCVFTDRYYTTVAMNYGMAKRKTFFVGTLRREQRTNLPKEIMEGSRRNPTPPAVLALKKGQTLKMHSNHGDTEAITWMDNRAVTFLSSIASDYSTTTCSRKRKEPTRGGFYSELIQQPAVAVEFNMKMGGVDRHDQMVHSVKQHRRSVKCFVLWRDFHPSSNLQHKGAKEKVVENLFEFVRLLSSIPCQISCTASSHRPNRIPRKLPAIEIKVLRKDKSHMHYPRASDVRNSCKGHMQRVDVNIFCSRCGVYLCIAGGCFERFHEKDFYLFDDPLLSDKPISRSSCDY